jgi:hypothetical protein
MPVLPIARWLRTFIRNAGFPKMFRGIGRGRSADYSVPVTQYGLFKGVVYVVRGLKGDVCRQITGVL